MERLSPAQIRTINAHLAGDFSTLRVAFTGGHRETLIDIEMSEPDGLIVGENHAGDRVEFWPADVACLTYVKVDERVMDAEELHAHRATSTTLEGDGPNKVRRRVGRAPRRANAG